MSPDTVNVMMGSTTVSVDKVIVHSGYSQTGVFFNVFFHTKTPLKFIYEGMLFGLHYWSILCEVVT